MCIDSQLHSHVGAGHARDNTCSRAWPAPTPPQHGVSLIELIICGGAA